MEHAFEKTREKIIRRGRLLGFKLDTPVTEINDKKVSV